MEAKIPDPNAPDSEFDLLKSQCGEYYKKGTSREVYLIPGCLDKVLKYCYIERNICNWNEIVSYCALNDKSKFGEITSWSSSGRYLVMEFLADLDRQVSALDNLPFIWNDKKPENLGISKSGEIKIRDYGMIYLEPNMVGPIFPELLPFL